ncbi:hypothetical protein BDQ17DRAFT_1430849 [Cyathus striatus]|nr:hypothetical protein BDQ17DRAFT_1430849 [Cyathus striatus]
MAPGRLPMTLAELGQKPLKNMAKIEKDVSAERLVDQIMDTEITISQKELLALAPSVRADLQSRLAAKRTAIDNVNKPFEKRADVPVRSVNTEQVKPAHWTGKSKYETTKRILASDLALVKIERKSWKGTGTGPERQVWKVDDPVSQYLLGLPEEIREERYLAARESETLRAIKVLVNSAREEEALLDSGSQIVSMSQEMAVACGVGWDPSMRIQIQGGNGEYEPSIGLARDVPLKLGPVTVLLQIHILKKPPYGLLLGRPFDVLTESSIKNTLDGGQLITLTDPVTSEKIALPTQE